MHQSKFPFVETKVLLDKKMKIMTTKDEWMLMIYPSSIEKCLKVWEDDGIEKTILWEEVGLVGSACYEKPILIFSCML